MRPAERVEQAAIEAARAYAAANGRRRDPTAIGLFIAGLVIGARCSGAARDVLVAGYRAQFPQDELTGLDLWAAKIDEAAR